MQLKTHARETFRCALRSATLLGVVRSNTLLLSTPAWYSHCYPLVPALSVGAGPGLDAEKKEMSLPAHWNGLTRTASVSVSPLVCGPVVD